MISINVMIKMVLLTDWLSVCLLDCLTDWLSVYLCVCLFVCLSVYLFVCLCVCLSICLSVCLPVCLSVCVSVCLTVCLSVCVSVCLSLFMNNCYLFFPQFRCPYSIKWIGRNCTIWTFRIRTYQWNVPYSRWQRWTKRFSSPTVRGAGCNAALSKKRWESTSPFLSFSLNHWYFNSKKINQKISKIK